MPALKPTDGQPILKVLGDELRSLRKKRRWTRKELTRRLGGTISTPALASYELGTRHCSVARLIQICEILGEPPQDTLARVYHRLNPVEQDEYVVHIDRLVRDQRPELRPLALWASRQRQVQPQKTHVILSRPALESMAYLCGMASAKLARVLLDAQRTPRGHARNLARRLRPADRHQGHAHNDIVASMPAV